MSEGASDQETRGELRELSHTADVGFEARASTLEGIFEAAALGLLRSLGLPSRASDASAEADPAGGAEGNGVDRIELRASDRERLVVAWLRELLHRAQNDGRIAEVERIAISEGPGGELTLRSRLRWRAFPAESLEREIKGVTYHGLRVEETEEGWHARVVLDV